MLKLSKTRLIPVKLLRILHISQATFWAKRKKLLGKYAILVDTFWGIIQPQTQEIKRFHHQLFEEICGGLVRASQLAHLAATSRWECHYSYAIRRTGRSVRKDKRRDACRREDGTGLRGPAWVNDHIFIQKADDEIFSFLAFVAQ